MYYAFMLYFRIKSLKIKLTAFPFLLWTKVMLKVLVIRQMDVRPS